MLKLGPRAHIDVTKVCYGLNEVIFEGGRKREDSKNITEMQIAGNWNGDHGFDIADEWRL